MHRERMAIRPRESEANDRNQAEREPCVDIAAYQADNHLRVGARAAY